MSQWDPAVCKGATVKGPFWQPQEGPIPPGGWWISSYPPLECAVSGSPPPTALCKIFVRIATGQTIAFLFLLLAADLDSVSQANFQS